MAVNDEGIEAAVRQWLSETGWNVQAADARHTRFNVVATSPSGIRITIYRPDDRPRELTITTGVSVSGALLDGLMGLTEQVAGRLTIDIALEALRLGVDYQSPHARPRQVTVAATLYDEELDKPTLLHRVILVGRMAVIALYLIRRATGGGTDAVADRSAEGDPI